MSGTGACVRENARSQILIETQLKHRKGHIAQADTEVALVKAKQPLCAPDGGDPLQNAAVHTSLQPLLDQLARRQGNRRRNECDAAAQEHPERHESRWDSAWFCTPCFDPLVGEELEAARDGIGGDVALGASEESNGPASL